MDVKEDLFRQTAEKILPHYLAGVVDESVLDCYVHRRFNPGDLEHGFHLGLNQGKGLAKLLRIQSPELDIAICGARSYADRNSRSRRFNDSDTLNFENRDFLYGFFNGLSTSTTIIMLRDTESDVLRAFDAVLKKYGYKILTPVLES